jgi:cation:H+ antiporter
MAVATSIPELFVGITSALEKNPALALGNIMGANILDLTIITGIIILLGRGVKIKTRKIKKDALYMSLILILPIILFLIGNSISRIDGLILIGVFCLYAYRLLKRRKKFTKAVEDHIRRREIVINIFLFIASIVVLFLSSRFVVHYATLLSVDLNLPSIMVGLFLISIGTTLPELTFGVRAVQLGHSEMALGDQIGTIIANTTLILGVTALIYPIHAEFILFVIGAIFMILVGFLFATFSESGSKLDIKEGISLILLYIFFVIIEFYMKTIS